MIFYCPIVRKIKKKAMSEKENGIISAETNAEETYNKVRSSVITAQSHIYTAVNTAMVQAYWEIGEQIFIACGENDRAEYGAGLLKYLSGKLTAEFGKGFTERNLRNMRQFYQCYPIRHTVCTELSWSHYRVLMRISDEKRREWYTKECAKSDWSVRQLERQINTMFLSVCWQVRRKTRLPRKFKQPSQSLNMRRLSVIHMYLNFLICLQIPISMKRT